MSNVLVRSDSILIRTDQMARLFDKNELTGIRIRANKNCCSNLSFEKEFSFCNVKEDCKQTLLYCTDSPGDICSDDIESGSPVCNEADLFTYIRKFYFKINGVSYNILSSGDSFDIRDNNHMTAFKTKVLDWLATKSCVDVTMDLKVTSNDGNYCLRITFENLPYGYVPDYLQIRGKSVCFAKAYFDCLVVDNIDPCLDDDYARCLDFELRIPLMEGNYKLFVLNVQKSDCTKEEIQLVQETELASNLWYEFDYSTTGSTVLFDQLYTQINTWLTDNEYTGTFTISILGGELIIHFEGLPIGLLPLNISYQDPEKFNIGDFVCNSVTSATPSCVWTATIPTESGCDVGASYLAYVTKWIEDSVGPVTSSFAASLEISKTSEIRTALISVFPDGIVTYENNVIKIRDSVDVPDAVFIQRPDGTTEKIKFTCANLIHVCDSDSEDTSAVGFTQDSLLIYPELFSQSTISDGVYGFEIVYVGRDGDLTVENYCVFQDAEIKCKLITVIEKNPLSDVHHLYEVIKLAGDCYDCDCEKACLIYKQLVKKVNKELNASSQTDLCGCS